MQPFRLIAAPKRPPASAWNMHSGPFGAYDEAVNFGVNYKDVAKGSGQSGRQANWLGFTDIYWMSVLVPDATPATGDSAALAMSCSAPIWSISRRPLRRVRPPVAPRVCSRAPRKTAARQV
jgi:hypothetical protein